MKKNVKLKIACISIYLLFLIVSLIFGYNPGKEIAFNLISFLLYMLKILPCAFILIGLFEVWVKKEVIEKHLGEESGIKGYAWVVLLAGTIAGGLLVAFPVAYSLYNKGAKLSIIFTYIGAAAICRVPMALFEISFMGVKFTTIRLLISLPLVIITSILLGDYLTKRNYKMVEGR
ncbi:MAG: permease [Atribacterota bacterium]